MGILAQKVYEGGWEAKTQQELISRIQLKLKKFDSIFLQSLMEGVKTMGGSSLKLKFSSFFNF